jgi:hypothetical protein
MLVVAIFFPQRPALHLGERQYSPELQRKMVETDARVKSFAMTQVVTAIWCEQKLSSRNIGRVVEEVGHELATLRNQEVDDFVHHRRQPEGTDPKYELVAVFVDGGRIQIRDEDAPPGVHGERWQEDKIARLQTMKTKTFAADPCPEPPACFLKPNLLDEPPVRPQPPSAPIIPEVIASLLEAVAVPEAAPSWAPEPLVRTCVATMQPLETFRWQVQTEAKKRHFYTAQKRAFVADGSSGNWSLWERHFPDFEPILDFLHASSYLHGAAKVLDHATQGCDWVRDLWQGRGATVCAALRAALDERGIGLDTLDEKHPCFALQRAWTYLTNAAERIDYPRYRQAGLPCTSSLIESQIKEFNARVKGSEKFWHESNAEAMLQVLCWTLRDDGVTLENYFETRPTSPFRNKETQTLAC